MAAKILIAAGLAAVAVILGVVGNWFNKPAKITVRTVSSLFVILLVVYAAGTGYQQYKEQQGAQPATSRGSGNGSTTGPQHVNPPITQQQPSTPAMAEPSPSSAVSQTTDDQGAAPGPAVSQLPPSPEYLSSTDYVNSSGDTMDIGQASIRNQTYNHSVGLCADGIFGMNRCANNGANTWVEYNIDSYYRSLVATIGVSSSSSSDCQLYGQVLVDGVEVFGKQLAFGDQYPLSESVGEKLRIRLQMHALAGHGRCDLIYGNIALKR